MKKTAGFLMLLALIIGCKHKTTNQSENTKASVSPKILPSGSIEKIDPSLDNLIAPNTKIEMLDSGYEWLEGPVWVNSRNFLLFSDVMTNTVYQWTNRDGVKQYLKPSGYTGTVERGAELGSNGLLINRQGQLVLCQHGNRQVARMNAPLEAPKPDFVAIANNYEGKRLNSPNDLIQKSNGDIYFTDPAYGLENKMDDPAKELDFQGVFKVTPQGEITLLTSELSRPNGLAFSPDESKLYVANSDQDHAVWMVYEVGKDGLINNGKVFYDVTEIAKTATGLPDGMKVDHQGNIFASGPGGMWIFNPAGKVLGKIHTGQAISNCAFDFTNHWLYITSDMFLLRVSLK